MRRYIFIFVTTFVLSLWGFSKLINTTDINRQVAVANSAVNSVSAVRTPLPTPDALPTRILSRADAERLRNNNQVEVIQANTQEYNDDWWHIWSPRVLATAILLSMILLWPVAYVKAKRYEVDKRAQIELEIARLNSVKNKDKPIVQNVRAPNGCLQTADGREVSEDTIKRFVANFSEVGLSADDWVSRGVDRQEINAIIDLLAERGVVTPRINGITVEFTSENGSRIREVTRALGI
jgi:hypothetical protein